MQNVTVRSSSSRKLFVPKTSSKWLTWRACTDTRTWRRDRFTIEPWLLGDAVLCLFNRVIGVRRAAEPAARGKREVWPRVICRDGRDHALFTCTEQWASTIANPELRDNRGFNKRTAEPKARLLWPGNAKCKNKTDPSRLLSRATSKLVCTSHSTLRHPTATHHIPGRWVLFYVPAKISKLSYMAAVCALS